MNEERRAHERIDALEATMTRHMIEHARLEKTLTETSEMTKRLVDNTSEIVVLVRGAKGFRAFLLWITPVVAALYAAYVWVKS